MLREIMKFVDGNYAASIWQRRVHKSLLITTVPKCKPPSKLHFKIIKNNFVNPDDGEWETLVYFY